ncbi:MAG: hypothetical protein ACRDJ3_00670 [Solirubrobacteraceae bacterium]
MLRKCRPKAFGVVGSITVLTALAISGTVAASAWAVVGGPVWLVKGTVLAGGAKETLTSSGGVFKLDGTTNIECQTEKDTGEIIGTNPGLDLSTITFEKCFVEGKASCLAGNVTAESIEVHVQSLLVYQHEKPETTEQAYDAFFPDNGETSNNLFVEFTLTGGITPCGLLNGFKVNVNATGSLVTFDGINKKCGALAEVGHLNGLSEFVLSGAGEETTLGALNSKGEPEEATMWNSEKGIFETLTCKLEAFGVALQLGVSDISLVSGLSFGWEV